MSYSFNVRAVSKVEAIAQVGEQLDAVVLAQPPHAADRAHAEAATIGFIELLMDDDTHDVTVAVSGSLWVNDGGTRQSNVSITASLAPKVQA